MDALRRLCKISTKDSLLVMIMTMIYAPHTALDEIKTRQLVWFMESENQSRRGDERILI